MTFLQLYDEFLANPAIGQSNLMHLTDSPLDLIRNFLYTSKSQFPSDILTSEEIQHIYYLDLLSHLPLFREMVRSAQVRIHKTMKEAYLESVKQVATGRAFSLRSFTLMLFFCSLLSLTQC